VLHATGSCTDPDLRGPSAHPDTVSGVPGTLYITGDESADGLLNRDGTALLIGMLLDQQVPM
jgi:hypothetical protein